MSWTREYITKYLDRIGFGSYPAYLTESTMIKLHKCHILSIPFEDIDIHLNKPLNLDADSLFDKIINRKRGGFCYELNYLFYTLLVNLRFDVRIVSSRIFTPNGHLGPEYDHMSLIVQLQEEWLVDVGYGDLFIRPIPITTGQAQRDLFKTYRIDRNANDTFILSESRDGMEFTARYQFNNKACKVEDFQEQCEWKQNHPDSYFVKNYICTLPTINGRNTIMNNSLINWQDGIRKEKEITSNQQLHQLLKDRFDVVLEL